MSTVKLPSKQFNALEALDMKWNRKCIIATSIIGPLYRGCSEDELIHIKAIKEMEFDDLLLALANGYELEGGSEACRTK